MRGTAVEGQPRWDLKEELTAKGRIMNKRTYGRTNPLAREAPLEAVEERMVDTRKGVTQEGAA